MFKNNSEKNSMLILERRSKSSLGDQTSFPERYYNKKAGTIIRPFYEIYLQSFPRYGVMLPLAPIVKV
jgi:hypothetical protein